LLFDVSVLLPVVVALFVMGGYFIVDMTYEYIIEMVGFVVYMMDHIVSYFIVDMTCEYIIELVGFVVYMMDHIAIY